MGRLTTHVLDTAQGVPARGVSVTLRRVPGPDRLPVAQGITNGDGRLDAPLLAGEAFVDGTYELDFTIGDYFAAQPVAAADPPFLDVVTIRFTVADSGSHYHIPLLVSPWAYSTYRGS